MTREFWRTFAILLAALAAAPSARAVQAPPVADAPLEPAAGRQVAETLAGALEQLFVFPDVARRYAAALRAHAAAGDYDGLGGRAALAEALTRDVQAVEAEGHFRVFAAPPAGATPPAGAAVTPSRPEIEEARMLAPGIAYLRPTVFTGSPETIAAITRFLDRAEAEGTRTLIIDMRVHRGGGLDEMDAINRRIFARPTRLLVMDTRAAADGQLPFVESPTLRRVEAPAGIVRREHWAVPRPEGSRLAGAQVYLLVSGFTVSAGEHFALALQRTHRATLIGAGTQGAGNFGTIAPLGEGLGAFIGIGRTYDPDTGEGWEGIGVTPDVAVPAQRALVEALVRSGIASAEAERLSASVAPTGSMELRPGRPVPQPRARPARQS